MSLREAVRNGKTTHAANVGGILNDWGERWGKAEISQL